MKIHTSIALTINLLCVITTMVAAQTSVYVPGGYTSIINNTANGNVGIGTQGSANFALAIDAGSIAPLEMRTSDATFSFGGHILSLKAKTGFSNIPYIQWVHANGLRQGYMGWRTEALTLKLDNGYNFFIDGGRVGVGRLNPTATFEVKSIVPPVNNTEQPILRIISNVASGMEDNLFDLSQVVGTEGATHAILRLGNEFTNNGVPNKVVLNANGDSWFSGGQLGISTNNPVEQFQIGDRWTFHNGGHKIIGYNYDYDNGDKRIVAAEASALRFTNSGQIRFDVAGDDVAGSTIDFTTALTINNNGSIAWGNGGMLKRDHGSSIELGGSGTPYLDFKNDTDTDYDARFILRGDDKLELAGANLLVGKSNQTNTSYKIDVEGKVRANEIVVNTDGADYVFDPTYKLTQLDTLEAYVREHRHLPGIAPAREMQQEGMAVGETTTKLLEKVEELTLYMIEMKKINDTLREENRCQQEEIELLKKLIESKE